MHRKHQQFSSRLQSVLIYLLSGVGEKKVAPDMGGREGGRREEGRENRMDMHEYRWRRCMEGRGGGGGGGGGVAGSR